MFYSPCFLNGDYKWLEKLECVQKNGELGVKKELRAVWDLASPRPSLRRDCALIDHLCLSRGVVDGSHDRPQILC